MGVAGLTTFLREGRNSLATSLVLERPLSQDSDDADDAEHQRVLEPRENEIPLVIDAWGFVEVVKRILPTFTEMHCRFTDSCGASTRKT